MKVEELYEKYGTEVWFDYFPHEKHYANFEPKVIYSMEKVSDVYYAFSHARYCLSMLELSDYGEMIEKDNEISRKFLHSNLLVNALNKYFHAIDLSWQVMLFYVADNSLYFLSKSKAYDKFSNNCHLDFLLDVLKLRKEDALYYLAKEFSEKELSKRLREIYNFQKHRGAIHFIGLGQQNKSPYMRIKKKDGKDITFNMFVKREYELDELKQDLIELDKKIFEYMNCILKIITPQNYLTTEGRFEDVLNVSTAVDRFKKYELEEYEERFNEVWFNDNGYKK